MIASLAAIDEMIGRESMMGLMHLKPEGRCAGPRASQVTPEIPNVKLASDHTWGREWSCRELLVIFLFLFCSN